MLVLNKEELTNERVAEEIRKRSESKSSREAFTRVSVMIGKVKKHFCLAVLEGENLIRNANDGNDFFSFKGINSMEFSYAERYQQRRDLNAKR